MILPDSNISILTVRNATNYPSTDLGTLCSSPNVNKYSRYRPGYWEVVNQVLTFHLPKGGGYTDPRGSDGFSNLQLYKLGDFRGYNTSATAPCIKGAEAENSIIVGSAHTQATTIEHVIFDLGEVDWFGTENNYRGKNHILSNEELIVYKSEYLDRDYNYIISINKNDIRTPNEYTRSSSAEMDLPVNAPSSSGGTRTTYFKFGLGVNHKIYAYFPNIIKYICKKISGALYTLNVPESRYASLKSNLNGLDASDSSNSIYRVSTYNGEITSGRSTILIPDVEFIITMDNSYNRYAITSAGLRMQGTITCSNASGFKSKNLFDITAIVTPDAGFDDNPNTKYDITFTLPETATEGETFNIEITDFHYPIITKL